MMDEKTELSDGTLTCPESPDQKAYKKNPPSELTDL